jgi:hypothetical protein
MISPDVGFQPTTILDDLLQYLFRPVHSNTFCYGLFSPVINYENLASVNGHGATTRVGLED